MNEQVSKLQGQLKEVKRGSTSKPNESGVQDILKKYIELKGSSEKELKAREQQIKDLEGELLGVNTHCS